MCHRSFHDRLCPVHEVGHHWTPRLTRRVRQLAEESPQRPPQALQTRSLCHWLSTFFGLVGLDVAAGMGCGTQQGTPLLLVGGEGSWLGGAQLRVVETIPIAQQHEVHLHVALGLYLEIHLLLSQHLQGVGPLQKGQLVGQELAQLGQENRSSGGLWYLPHACHGTLEWKAFGCLLLVRLFCWATWYHLAKSLKDVVQPRRVHEAIWNYDILYYMLEWHPKTRNNVVKALQFLHI